MQAFVYVRYLLIYEDTVDPGVGFLELVTWSGIFGVPIGVLSVDNIA